MQSVLLNRTDAGFTLTEVLVALVIGFVAVFAALHASSEAVKTKVNSDRRQQLANDFNLIGDYFARQLPSGAGAGLSATSSYWVEDDCHVRSDYPDCDGSDRLTMATATNPQACSVTSYNTGTNTANLTQPGLPCCLLTNDMFHHYVMIALDDTYAQKWVINQNVTSCTVGLRPGPMSPNDTATPGFDFAGGFIVPISIRTFYADISTQTLFVSDYGADAASVSQQRGRITPLADRVLDFQISLGFDFKPRDGQIIDSASRTDEWLFNASGLPHESRADTNFLTASDFSLRMIAVGLGLAVPVSPSVTIKEIQLFDGPVRTKPGSALQSAVMKFGIRSGSTFD